MKILKHTVTAAIAVLVMASSSAFAIEPPAEQTVGDITYITGGIGERETKELRAERQKYDLRVINAGKKGAFIGEANLIIRDSKGEEVLNVDAGPLFYASMPAGRYTVEVEKSDEGVQKKSVTVKSGKQETLRFFWKPADSTK